MTTKASSKKNSTEFDNPWKEIIERYFEAFMSFFFPQVYEQIDFNRGYEFLDKELQKVIRQAKMKRRAVDKLVKVWLKNGVTSVLYIHIEIQAQYDESFTKRVFIYYYRLFDRYGTQVISLAILGDNKKGWLPKNYHLEKLGCKLLFEFPIVKLLDYKDKWQELEQSKNPFSIVVRTHLKGLSTRRSSQKRYQQKVELFKALQEANYTEEDTWELLRFIDWVLALPEDLERQFDDFVKQYQEKQKMPYVTSFERFAREEGVLQTSREYVVDLLKLRFKRVPQTLVKTIETIDDTRLLSKLFKNAALVESLDSFKQVAEKQLNGKHRGKNG